MYIMCNYFGYQSSQEALRGGHYYMFLTNIVLIIVRSSVLLHLLYAKKDFIQYYSNKREDCHYAEL